MFARPAGREVVDRGLDAGERRAAVGPVSLLLGRCQHGRRGLVRLQHRLCQQLGSERIRQRLQPYTAGAHPFGQSGTRDRQTRAE